MPTALSEGSPRTAAACVLADRIAQGSIAHSGTEDMFDTATARRMMVDGQVRTADVTNLDLIGAMLAVPRELFVPPALADQAYLDSDIALGGGRALLKPMVLAKLIQGAHVGAGDRVLDVGCATGYSSAVLSRLAGSVVALEEDAALAQRARDALVSRRRHSRYGCYRAADRRLAVGRSLRPHFAQRRHRNRARCLRPPVEARWPARLHSRPHPDRQSYDLSDDRGPPCRPPDF